MRSKLTLSALLAVATVLGATPVAARDITVFAAASLKTALDQIAADWTAQTGDKVVISYAGSSLLARQIQQGAPADVFISASTDWMDAVAQDGLIDPAARVDLLGNTLVLIAADPDAQPVKLSALPGVLGDGKLAMALVEFRPRRHLWQGRADRPWPVGRGGAAGRPGR